MSLDQWGLVFEHQPEEPDFWDVVPDSGVQLSDHGAHVLGYPRFVTYCRDKTKHWSWGIVEGGYIRGI